MQILEYPLVEEGALSGNDSFIVETSEGTKRITIDELQEKLDISVNYPIGYVYMSFESTSPAELFGGSWLKLEDVFLRASNNLDTGGSDTVTLTTSQIPSHYHGNHEAKSGFESSGYGLTTATGFVDRVMVWQNGTAVTNTTSNGGNGSHSNMPKYQNVYAWRKIS